MNDDRAVYCSFPEGNGAIYSGVHCQPLRVRVDALARHLLNASASALVCETVPSPSPLHVVDDDGHLHPGIRTKASARGSHALGLCPHLRGMDPAAARQFRGRVPRLPAANAGKPSARTEQNSWWGVGLGISSAHRGRAQANRDQACVKVLMLSHVTRARGLGPGWPTWASEQPRQNVVRRQSVHALPGMPCCERIAPRAMHGRRQPQSNPRQI